MDKFGSSSFGGPLFLKLLLDQVTTTGEANLRALKATIENYSIKGNCPGEDINKVTDELGTVYKTINTLTGGVLPDGAVLRLKHILQTTSVPTFNEVFRGQELELTQ